MWYAVVNLTRVFAAVLPIDEIDHARIAVAGESLLQYFAKPISACETQHDVVDTTTHRSLTGLPDKRQQCRVVVRGLLINVTGTHFQVGIPAVASAAAAVLVPRC